MSLEYYTNEWRLAQSDINNMLAIEKATKPGPPVFTREGAIRKIFQRYAQYIDIFKRLQMCYDNMVHPHKRMLMAKCLEGIVGRIVELRHELLRIRVIESLPFGILCLEFKIHPNDIEFQLSHSFANEKAERIRSRETLLQQILKAMEEGTVPTSQDTASGNVNSQTMQKLELDNDEAATNASEISIVETQVRRPPLVPTYRIREIERRARVPSLIKFQAMWNGHKARRKTAKMAIEDEIFLGMRQPPVSKRITKDGETSIAIRRLKEAEKNKEIYMREVFLQTQTMKDGPVGKSMMQDMVITIQQWILDCRDMTGKFPDYPPDDMGGSAILFTDKTPEEVLEEIEEELENQGKKKPKPKAPAKKEDKGKKTKQKKEGPESYMVPKSLVVGEILIDEAIEYQDIWCNRDESENRDQGYDRTLLFETVKGNVETLIRKQVDEIMRFELDKIASAVDKQNMPILKPTKQKKEKNPKGKKKPKDLTQGIPMDELFKELVMNGIVKRVAYTPLKSFIGAVNLLPDEAFPNGLSKPDFGDIRKMIFDFAILPMCTPGIHEHAPFDKSLLIAGPRGCGKKMLVNAICHELGANLFDLSATTLAGKYPGKEGQKRLAHLIMKVGKELEPTIFLIDECELVFCKKPPPGTPPNPTRMKADLMKIKKMITPEDRIMIIGVTTKPFRASQDPMMKLFDRTVFIYPPTHASRYKIWEAKIKELKGVASRRCLELTTLAQLSSSFTPQAMLIAATEVLTESRVLRQRKYPLRTREFVDRLGVYYPVYQEELQTLEDWLASTPSCRKNEAMRELEASGGDVIALLNAELEMEE